MLTQKKSIKALFILPFLSFFTSFVFSQELAIEPLINEAYSSATKAKIRQLDLTFGESIVPEKVTVEIIDGYVIMDGDIILGTETEVFNSAAVYNVAAREWPNSTIPYVIAASFADPDKIKYAINHIINNTNMCMVERTTETNYVEFINSLGCSSSIGMVGGRQYIRIASGCGIGTTVHEILHASGHWHEQSRADRDTYVTINLDNVETGKEHNFNQYSTGADIGSYDYGSLMHYGATAFSTNDEKTITINIPPGTASTIIGQRINMSAGDISAVNQIYTSTPTCSTLIVPANLAIKEYGTFTVDNSGIVTITGVVIENNGSSATAAATTIRVIRTNSAGSNIVTSSYNIPILAAGATHNMETMTYDVSNAANDIYSFGIWIDPFRALTDGNTADNYLLTDAPTITLPLPCPTDLNLGTITAPTICSGTDGSIQVTGLIAATDYTLNYKKDGVAINPAITFTAASTTYDISALGAGAYTDIIFTSTCTSNTLNQTLNDPTPSTAAVISGTASICAGESTDISVDIMGGASPYTLVYNNGTSNTTVNAYTSGTDISISPIADSTFTLVSITDANNCAGTNLSGSAEITVKPIPVIALGTTTNPSTCGGSEGNIQLTGLVASNAYILNYKKEDNAVNPVNFTAASTSYNMASLGAGAYTEIAVTLAGCPSNELSQTLVDPTPSTAAVISGTASICAGESTDISVAITGGASPYTLVYNNGINNTTVSSYTSGTDISISPIADSTFTLVSITDANNCTGTNLSGSAEITVKPIPVIALGTTTNPITCGGSEGNIQITGLVTSNAYVLNYKKDGNAVSPVNFTAASTSYNMASLGEGAYTEIAVTLAGCPSNELSQTLVDPIPSTAAIISGTASICAGESTDISVDITGGASPFTVVYNNGISNTTLSSYVSGTAININPIADSTFTLVSITDANNCAGTNLSGSAEITVKPIPVIALGTTTNPITCGGSEGNIQITGLVTSNAYVLNYKKEGNAVSPVNFTAASTSYNMALLGAGVYTEITVTLAGCPSNELSHTLVDPTPSTAAIISGTASICAGESTDISVAITGGASPFTVVYNNGTNNTTVSSYVSGTAININPISDSTFTLVSITDANNCAGTNLSGSAEITVKPIPVIALGTTTNPSTCGGSEGDIQITGLVASNAYVLNYKKDGNAVNPVNFTAASTSYNMASLGAGVYTEIAVTLAGCPSNELSQTLVDPTPSTAAIISGTASICAGESTDISVAITGGASPFTVVYNNGTNNTTISSYTSGTDISISPIADSTFTLVSITDANNCAGTNLSGSAEITVKPIPVIALGTTTNPSTCGGSEGDIQLTGLVASNAYVLNYKKDGNAVSPVNFTAASTSYNIASLGAGTYTEIKVTLAGCPSNELSQTLVDPTPSTAAVISGTASICAGESTDISVAITGGASPFTVVYNNGTNNTTVSSYVSGTAININPIADSTFTLVSITDANNCAGTNLSGSAEITVKPIPVIALGTTTNPSTCGGSEGNIQLTGLVASNAYVLNYKKEDNAVSPVNFTAASTSYDMASLGAGTYTEIKVTLAGCPSNELSHALVDPNNPTLDAINNQIITAENTVATIVFSGTSGATFIWTNDNASIGLGTNGTGNILAFTAINGGSTPITGNITVTPTLNGCTGVSQSFSITVNPLVVSDCPNTLEVRSPVTDNTTYEASGTLTSTATIPANFRVTYTAGTAIILGENFHATANSNFTAKIAPCSAATATTINASRNTGAVNLSKLSLTETINMTIQPNPANQWIRIDFSLVAPSKVAIDLYSFTGHPIKSIISFQEKLAGSHQQNLAINDLNTGMYFVVLRSESQVVTQRLMVLK